MQGPQAVSGEPGCKQRLVGSTARALSLTHLGISVSQGWRRSPRASTEPPWAKRALLRDTQPSEGAVFQGARSGLGAWVSTSVSQAVLPLWPARVCTEDWGAGDPTPHSIPPGWRC